MEKAAIAVVALLAFVLAAVQTGAEMPINPYVKLPKNPYGPKFAKTPEPLPKPIVGPPPAEPHDTFTKVYNCWGYLGKPMAIPFVKAFFVNGTLPGPVICEGVVKLHPHCFPDMFKVWYFVNTERIYRLRYHCLSLFRRPSGGSGGRRPPLA